MNRRLPLISALAAAGLSACSAPSEDPRVAEVVARTRTTKATYALYSWNRITKPGEAPVGEWSAEFHAGVLHRVETPRDRLVADCAAGKGWRLSVASGEVEEGPQYARSACGIDANFDVRSSAWVAHVATPFGRADRVRFTDRTYIRTYDISADGVILKSSYLANRADRAPVIVSEAVAVSKELPEAQIFDPASLRRSVVPERYLTAP